MSHFFCRRVSLAWSLGFHLFLLVLLRWLWPQWIRWASILWLLCFGTLWSGFFSRRVTSLGLRRSGRPQDGPQRLEEAGIKSKSKIRNLGSGLPQLDFFHDCSRGPYGHINTIYSQTESSSSIFCLSYEAWTLPQSDGWCCEARWLSWQNLCRDFGMAEIDF